MESSMIRVAPARRESWICEGGTRPAARWPTSVRSRRPAIALDSALASVAGSIFRMRSRRGTGASRRRRRLAVPARLAVLPIRVSSVPREVDEAVDGVGADEPYPHLVAHVEALLAAHHPSLHRRA